MIQCRPSGLFSWNFILSGGGLKAEARFNWVGESGVVMLNGVTYAIEKSGLIAPVWRLLRDGRVSATATKASAFTRTFEIKTETEVLTLKAASALGRKMELNGSNCEVTIEPKHAFTRRAMISGTVFDPETVLFAFWLSVLVWRRSANSSAAASS